MNKYYMKLVKEYIFEFERGQDPFKAMDIGLNRTYFSSLKEWGDFIYDNLEYLTGYKPSKRLLCQPESSNIFKEHFFKKMAEYIKRIEVNINGAGADDDDFDKWQVLDIIKLKLDNLNESLEILNEIGEATAKPYKITKFRGSLIHGTKIYEFETEDEDSYEIFIQALDNTLANVSFRLKNNEDTSKVVNKGRIFRILATVVNCIKLFYKSYNGDISFMIIADKSKSDDSRRFNIYVKYVKTLVPTWKIHVGKTEIKDILYDKMIIHPEDMYCSLCEI